MQPTSTILVALMPKARDMEIARLFGWYRIPMKSAPKILRVDYIAFYQTADFGADRGGRIERYAPVSGVELTTRAELFRNEPDHPRAREYYYKVQIGALQSLPEPILAGKWRRFLFVYTNGRQFRTAKTIRDLADGFNRVDAAIGYSADPWNLTLAVSNLTNKEYWRSDSMPGTPRSFLMRLNYQF